MWLDKSLSTHCTVCNAVYNQWEMLVKQRLMHCHNDNVKCRSVNLYIISDTIKK